MDVPAHSGGGGPLQPLWCSAKHARGDAPTGTEVAVDVPPEVLQHYHSLVLAGASNGFEPLSFDSLYGRETLLPAQVSGTRGWLHDCEGLLNLAMQGGDVLHPGSDLVTGGHIDVRADIFSTENKRSHVYREMVSGKSGVAANAGVRTAHVKTALAKKGKKDTTFFSSIDIDNMAVPVQRAVTARFLEMAKKHCSFKEHPVTLGDLVAGDMHGTPAYHQMTLHSLVHDTEECVYAGGGLGVRGILPASIRCALESGEQMSLRRLGIPTTGAKHENVRSDLLPRGLAKERAIRHNATACFKTIIHPHELKAAQEESMEAFIRSSWEPGELPTHPPKAKGFTAMLNDKAVGEYNWANALVGWPMENPQNIKQCYDPSLFSRRRCFAGAHLTIQDIDLLEQVGGYCLGIDECKLIWLKSKCKSIIAYLTEVRESPFEDGSRWYVAWKATGITVLKLDYLGDGRVRIIVVFIAWGTMIHYENGTPINWWDLPKMDRAAESCHWFISFKELLREENCSLEVDAALHRRLEDCIYILFTMFVYDTKIAHEPPKSAILKFKQRMEGGKMNVYDPSCTNLLRDSGDLGVYGSSGRKNIGRQSTKKTSVRRNRRWLRQAFQFASAASLPEPPRTYADGNRAPLVRLSDSAAAAAANAATEVTLGRIAQDFVRSIRHERHENNRPCRKGVPSKRYKIVKKAHQKGTITRALWRKIRAEYKATRANSGNTSNHHSASTDTIANTNRLLEHYASTGEKFFLQAGGNSAKAGPTKLDGSPFEIPQDGVSLRPNPQGRWKRDAPTRFVRDRFVPGICFGSARDRCSDSKPAGTTSHTTATRFPGYSLKYTRGIFAFDSSKKPAVTYVNEYCVAEAYFVKDPAKAAKAAKSS